MKGEESELWFACADPSCHKDTWSLTKLELLAQWQSWSLGTQHRQEADCGELETCLRTLPRCLQNLLPRSWGNSMPEAQFLTLPACTQGGKTRIRQQTFEEGCLEAATVHGWWEAP